MNIDKVVKINNDKNLAIFILINLFFFTENEIRF
jgi:hypothetical protein